MNSKIQYILENIDEEGLEKLISNVVNFSIKNHATRINWKAHELFVDVISENKISELFDEDSKKNFLKRKEVDIICLQKKSCY